ncbi:5-carboxymethyl-2-hydroxymuconate Delta-isomerase [Streptomyces sp. NPDC051310]|uniref:5-carboxymethyl-2-hydroxymuconate Delta-isomerase n=1 Tax=Streptomyces sp. NPDC051310 TaxID=3365649 RepID=UPI00379A5220
MPQIAVDYSASLDEAFDRRGFALALHPVLGATVGANPAVCKTRFRRAEETVVADGTTEQAVVHVAVGLAPGRREEAKARLTEAVLALVPQHLKPVDGLTVHISAEVHDFAPSYRRR